MCVCVCVLEGGRRHLTYTFYSFVGKPYHKKVRSINIIMHSGAEAAERETEKVAVRGRSNLLNRGS